MAPTWHNYHSISPLTERLQLSTVVLQLSTASKSLFALSLSGWVERFSFYPHHHQTTQAPNCQQNWHAELSNNIEVVGVTCSDASCSLHDNFILRDWWLCEMGGALACLSNCTQSNWEENWVKSPILLQNVSEHFTWFIGKQIYPQKKSFIVIGKMLLFPFPNMYQFISWCKCAWFSNMAFSLVSSLYFEPVLLLPWRYSWVAAAAVHSVLPAFFINTLQE